MQSRGHDANFYSFDICEDTGGADAFFPSGLGALIGNFTEVSCNQWSGSNGGALWNGACLAGETAGNWPAIGCGNEGTPCLPRDYPYNLERTIRYCSLNGHRLKLTKYQLRWLFCISRILCIIMGFSFGHVYERGLGVRKKGLS